VLADCRGADPRKARGANAYDCGRKLESKWLTAKTTAERAKIERATDRLAHGEHKKYPGIEVEELLMPELTCDADYNQPHTPEFRRAWLHADSLYRQYGYAQGAKDRQEIRDALEPFFAGTHPSHPGIKLDRNEFDITDRSKWRTHDAAFKKRRARTRDVLSPDDIDLIFAALKALCRRLDRLSENPMFTRGPATPRLHADPRRH